MSTDNNIERLLANYEAQTFSALSELQRKLIAAMDQRDTLGDIHQIGKIAKEYKQANKSSNETLALLSGVTSNTISTMTSDPTNSKISTVLALLDAMGMTLTISRKSANE
jgi:DNA-binding phage protein